MNFIITIIGCLSLIGANVTLYMCGLDWHDIEWWIISTGYACWGVAFKLEER